MSVWFTIPSCRPRAEAQACLNKWKERGYKTAVLRQGEPVDADLVIPTGGYLGWGRSTNILCRAVCRRTSAQWFIGGGDDYFPIPDFDADALGEEFHKYARIHERCGQSGLYVVVQPSGDRWGDSPSARQEYGEDRGAILDRVCGSPWMGREWIERSYLGNGPMFDGYHHLYADEELHEVAKAQKVLWNRRDLTQYHAHPARTHPQGFQACHEGHLAALYSSEAWARERAIFEERKAKGFPGSEPICR